MDGNRNLRFGGLCGEDNNVLMKSHVPPADEPWARRSSEGGRRAARATRHNLVKRGKVLSTKDIAARFRNVLPIHSVKILAFLVVLCIPFLPRLIFLDVQFSLLTNAGLVCTWADHNVLAINKFRIWVRATAPKALRCPRRRAPARIVPTVMLDRFFSLTGIRLAWGEVKLLAAAMLVSNNVPDMVQVVLSLD